MLMSSLCMTICFSIIQNATGVTTTSGYSSNLPFTEDFKKINHLGEMKDIQGLDNITVTLKTKWKDQDLASYCRLMDQVLKELRTDFNPVDYEKIKYYSNDVLLCLDKVFGECIDPVLIPHYFEFQAWYISSTYGNKYGLHTVKGDAQDEQWVIQRIDVMTRLLNSWRLLEKVRDPNWNINETLPSMNVTPPDGGPAGGSPEAIVNPTLRAQYEEEIKKVTEKQRAWGIQYELWKTERDLRKRLMNDIKAMYSTPPLAPDELKSLLDQYVKDEEQKKMFLEASQK